MVRDVLDKAVVDRHGHELGRVDGVMIDVRPGAPPRVSALEIGPSILAARIHPLLGRVVAALEYILDIDKGRPVRIELYEVIDVGDVITVDRVAAESAATVLERRLRRWVGSIPGSS
jgi:sporulation protein YlmC with PRC-barrel domain